MELGELERRTSLKTIYLMIFMILRLVKIIIPFLKKNYSFFRDFWEKAQMGYEMPVIDELGRQYCEENIH